MQWIEIDPIPEECNACHEEDCYHCDIAGKRWVLSRKDALLIRRKGILQRIRRLQRQVTEIDKELQTIKDP